MQVLWGVKQEVDLAHLTLASAPHFVQDWPRIARRYYKVAFVRNPYDRVLSAFAWQRERPRFAHNVDGGFVPFMRRLAAAAQGDAWLRSREFVHFWPAHHFTHRKKRGGGGGGGGVGGGGTWRGGAGAASAAGAAGEGGTGAGTAGDGDDDDGDDGAAPSSSYEREVNFIGKLENMDADFGAMLRKLRYPPLVAGAALKAGRKENVRRARRPLSELLAREHTAETIALTNAMYRLDFELFGYEMVQPEMVQPDGGGGGGCAVAQAAVGAVVAAGACAAQVGGAGHGSGEAGGAGTSVARAVPGVVAVAPAVVAACGGELEDGEVSGEEDEGGAGAAGAAAAPLPPPTGLDAPLAAARVQKRKRDSGR